MSVRTTCFVVIGLVSLTTSASAQLVFSENWDDLNGASRWSAPIVSDENPALGFDGLVDYAFDYSALGAPSAPHSSGGTTIGLRLETNKTDNGDPGLDQGEAVGVIPLSAFGTIPAGDFSLKVDAYSFVNTGDGTTEYTTLGVFNDGSAVPLRFFLNAGSGLAFSYDGEDGSSSKNLIRFANPGTQETSLGNWEDIPPGSIPGVTTCKPGVTCAGNTQIGPQNRWVELEIKSVGGMISFAMNGFVINTFDNMGGAFSAGKLLLSESDPFNSVSVPDGSGYKTLTLFDNVRLTVIPEPSSCLLFALGTAAVGLMRRRS